MINCQTLESILPLIVEFWSTHEELHKIEEVQAFGKLDESLDNTISDIAYSEEENGS